MNKKSQSFIIVLVILIILMIVMFSVGGLILKRIKIQNQNTTIENNNTNSYDINQSIMPGDTKEKKAEMAKDPNISPPELSGR